MYVDKKTEQHTVWTKSTIQKTNEQNLNQAYKRCTYNFNFLNVLQLKS